MDSFLQLLADVGNFFLPIFVFATMFNVGLTQKIKEIVAYLKQWHFYVRMLIVNFVVAPIVMFLMIQLFSISATLGAGLMIFSMCAGAPFLIKLTQYSDNDVALGASLMFVLVLFSCIYVPIVLPMVLSEVSVSAWELFITLSRQLIVPIVLGKIVESVASNFAKTIQPWVAKIGNISLWIVIIGTMVGNAQGLIQLAGEGAMLVGVAFIVIVTIVAYFFGGKNDQNDLKEVAALGTGQRNTAASMIIAANNFSDYPEVFLIITVSNMLGILMHLGLSKLMSENVLTED